MTLSLSSAVTVTEILYYSERFGEENRLYMFVVPDFSVEKLIIKENPQLPRI